MFGYLKFIDNFCSNNFGCDRVSSDNFGSHSFSSHSFSSHSFSSNSFSSYSFSSNNLGFIGEIFEIFERNGIKYFALEDGDYFLFLYKNLDKHLDKPLDKPLDKGWNNNFEFYKYSKKISDKIDDKVCFGDPFYFFELEKELREVIKKSGGGHKNFKLVISKDIFCSFAIGRAFDSGGFIYILEPEVFLKKVFFFEIFPYITFKYKNILNLPLSYIKKFSLEAKREFGSLLLSCFKREERNKLLNEINLLLGFFFEFFGGDSFLNFLNLSIFENLNIFEKESFPFTKLFEEIFGWIVYNKRRNLFKVIKHKSVEENVNKNLNMNVKEDIKENTKENTKENIKENIKENTKENEEVRFVFKFSGEKRFEREDFASFKEALFYFLSVNGILFSSIDAYIVYVDGKIYKGGKVKREENEKTFLFAIERLKELIIKNKNRDVNIKEIVLYIKIEEEVEKGIKKEIEKEKKNCDNYLFEDGEVEDNRGIEDKEIENEERKRNEIKINKINKIDGINKKNDERLFAAISHIFNKYGKVIKTGDL